MNNEHNITIKQRQSATVTGVEAVVAFDENNVTLQTKEGLLSIEGRDMNMTKLDTDGGEVIINGFINALYYPGQSAEKRGFISKLFS